MAGSVASRRLRLCVAWTSCRWRSELRGMSPSLWLGWLRTVGPRSGKCHFAHRESRRCAASLTDVPE
eukprot:15443747-Alexandrium_andersonii.AAC.1